MVWRSLSFALMLPFAAGATAGAAPDLPSPDALRALVAAASGARPVSYEERLRFTTSGAAGTETLLRAGDDFREIDDSGPLHRERGRYHGQDWHQNANGQTVLEQPDPGNGKRDDIVTTVARVTKPIDAFALRALNQVGSGTVTYIDPATDRVVREDRIEPAQTTVFAFDDFRSVDGYTTAWHWTRSDGHPENDGDYRVTSITPRSVAPNEVAIADPRRRLVEFPAGKTSVDLPVHMVGNNFIVRVTIAGRGFDFLLDTGTPNIQLDESVARGLGLTPLRSMSSSDFGGRVTEAAIVIPQAQVGDLRMHDIVALTIPRFPGGEAGTRIVGILGFDFVAELLLRLDYERERATAFDPAGTQLPALAGATTLSIRLRDQLPLTDVTVNGALGERFSVETGSDGALVVGSYFARHFSKAIVDLGAGVGYSTGMVDPGGFIPMQPFQVADLRIGTRRVRSFFALLMTGRVQPEEGNDGSIGNAILRDFTVWLDYPDSQIVLVPNRRARER